MEKWPLSAALAKDLGRACAEVLAEEGMQGGDVQPQSG